MTVPSSGLAVDFYLSAIPIILLGLGAVAALALSVASIQNKQTVLKTLTFVTITTALAFSFIRLFDQPSSNAVGTYVVEQTVSFGHIFILVLGLVTCSLFAASHSARSFFRGEIISIFLLVMTGMLVTVAANNLTSMFIGLELTSIGLCALIGFIQPTQASIEGSVKNLVLGAFASGFILFGFGLFYAATGSLQINEIVEFLPAAPSHPWLMTGGLLIMVGLGSKLAVAPFHLWAPDVYESAPTSLIAFIATSLNALVVIVILKFLGEGLPHMQEVWKPFLMFVAIASTVTGSLLALVQSSIKRMLAYSAVAHAGFIAIAMCAISATSKELPIASILFYLTTYAVVILGMCSILVWLESEQQTNIQLDHFSGFAAKHPLTAFGISIFMLSLAGMPPTAGFIGKFFIFSSAIFEHMYALVFFGIFGAIIALYCYLRVIVRMYMNTSLPATPLFNPKRSFTLSSITVIALIFTLLLGTFLPNSAMRLARKASMRVTSY